MRPYRVALIAKQDIEEIVTYYAKDSPAAAAELLQEFIERFNLLGILPGLGRPRPEYAGLHVFPVRDFFVMYRPFGRGVEIARVLHQARDLRAMFRKKK